jgi:hypothetical protein
MWSGIVSDSADCRWSTHGAKIGNRQEEWLGDDLYAISLTGSETKRSKGHAAWVNETIAAGKWELI